MFLYHRRDIRFGWMIWMFVAFIMLCGVTHFFAIWTLWNPDYGIEALVKAATAIASLLTAVAIWPLLPKIIALPTPAHLKAKIAERDEAVGQLSTAKIQMMEMEEHQRQQSLLLNELNHRVKNTLASVQSLTSQTLNRDGDVAELRETLVGRLMALSETHNLLTDRNWETISLRRLVGRVLDQYGRSYTYSGSDLELKSGAAVTLGMALHELATNALKYGAWSGTGFVAITVEADATGNVGITWTETGGPRVKSPKQRGFGSRLLETGVAAELAAEVELSFDPQGVTCRIVLPASPLVRPSHPASGV